MDFLEFQKKLKEKSKSLLPPAHKQDVGAALCIQVHSTGAMPKYRVNNQMVTPETYDKRFDDFFKQRILNRHPNENEEHYNWRLSAYAPVTKELFDKFLNLCKGSILQPNNYVLSSPDDKTSEYIARMQLNSFLGQMIDFILTNPIGYMAVIEADVREKGENEKTKPKIICIPAENLKMIDGNSIAFAYEGNVVYLNETEQKTITPDGDIYTYMHNLQELPAWQAKNSFLTPFAHWSNTLIRNLNEDEAVSKHYSYPIRQEISPVCNSCQGTGKVTNPDGGEYTETADCKTCLGTGTVSRNPGDIIMVPEEMLTKTNMTSMPDYAKYITPDIGIPKYHLDRWQVFYDKAEAALHLRPVSDKVQSGEGKKEDRKDQYIFLLTISNFLFDNFKIGLEYVSAYLNLRGSTHEKQSIVLVPPKQLDLMSDSDLMNDLLAVQSKTDDGMLLGELNYQVNNKIYRDDPVVMKISDILYEIDPLYGVSGNSLRGKELSGVYSTTDKVIHEKGYKILLKISREKTPDEFIKMETESIMSLFYEKVKAETPKTIYTEQ